MFATSQFLKPIKLTQRSEHLCTYRNNLKINVPLTLTITNGTCEQNFYTSALISFRLCTKCTDSILKRYFIAIPIHIKTFKASLYSSEKHFIFNNVLLMNRRLALKVFIIDKETSGKWIIKNKALVP